MLAAALVFLWKIQPIFTRKFTDFLLVYSLKYPFCETILISFVINLYGVKLYVLKYNLTLQLFNILQIETDLLQVILSSKLSYVGIYIPLNISIGFPKNLIPK